QTSPLPPTAAQCALAAAALPPERKYSHRAGTTVLRSRVLRRGAFLKLALWRSKPVSPPEEVMKAALALILIYVGTFLVAIQGASNNSAQAAQNTSQDAQASSPAGAIDPAKEADIRSLLELVGARDMIQDAANNSVEQIKEKIAASLPNNERAQK